MDPITAQMCKTPFFVLILGVKNGVKGESGASDDELNSDVVSHYSSASESTSVVEEGTGSSAKSRRTPPEPTWLPRGRWFDCPLFDVSSRRGAGG